MSNPAPILWFFGLPSAGKTTLAESVVNQYKTSGESAVLLDGDQLRGGLCQGLGFSDTDRAENIRRAAEVAKLLAAQGLRVVCAFITPREDHRLLVRSILGSSVMLIHVQCPLEVCSQRDMKGLYRKAAQKQMSDLTGTQAPFEPPLNCDWVICSDKLSVKEATQIILDQTSLNFNRTKLL